jgi:hypothetical protein
MPVAAATQDLLTPSRVKNCERVAPIFVTGVWRCGATLLYLLLNQHPDIALFFESDLPVLWPMFRMPWGRESWFDKWEYWNASVSRHDLNPARLASAGGSLPEAFEFAGRQFAAQHGKTRWGCKSPTYFDQIDHLASVFPKAKFVVVWRDPEEICKSALKAAKSGNSGQWFARPGTLHKLMAASEVLKKQVDKALTRGASVCQLHYHNLVGDTECVMRAVCAFLEVEFDPAVCVLKTADRSAIFKGEHHDLARGTSIVSEERHHPALPLHLARKIAGYRSLWKKQYGDGWWSSQNPCETGVGEPDLLERGWDRLRYLALRTVDVFPRLAFSMLPLSVWQTYRKFKYKDAMWVHRQITGKKTTLNLRGK